VSDPLSGELASSLEGIHDTLVRVEDLLPHRPTMKHRLLNKGNLGRHTAHRMSMFRTMTSQLIKNECKSTPQSRARAMFTSFFPQSCGPPWRR
jgi:hypothetical protein